MESRTRVASIILGLADDLAQGACDEYAAPEDRLHRARCSRSVEVIAGRYLIGELAEEEALRLAHAIGLSR